MKFQECLEYINDIPKEQCKKIRKIEISLPRIFSKVLTAKITFWFGIETKSLELIDRYDDVNSIPLEYLLSDKWQINIEYYPIYESIIIKDKNDK